MDSTTYGVIGRGLCGWHAAGRSGKNRCSSSGGTLEGYLKEAEDGALVYDASEADTDAFATFVINGPMCEPTLKPGTWRTFADRETAARMAPYLAGAFGTFARLGSLPEFSGLDEVAPDVYRTLLAAKVPGVKLGTVQNGTVVWDREEATDNVTRF